MKEPFEDSKKKDKEKPCPKTSTECILKKTSKSVLNFLCPEKYLQTSISYMNSKFYPFFIIFAISGLPRIMKLISHANIDDWRKYNFLTFDI